jgi:phenylacetate-CoA ligase
VPRSWKSRLRRVLKDRIFYLDTMRIDAAAIDRFLADWRRWRPGLLYGHAHSLFILAEALAERGVALRPRGIVATSMMLLEHERALIERVFAVPVTDRYGCEEVSLIGCECGEHRGLHLNLEHVHVEFLRDDGTACAAGEDGRIVVTELINLGMPLLRYELGDRGVPSDRRCPCGRGLPLMARVTGRVADFLRALDGSRVAGISLIERTLTRLPGLAQLQLVQEARERLVVNLVPGPGYGEETAAALIAALRDALGAGMQVELRSVERIPQERSGKYRFSICRV